MLTKIQKGMVSNLSIMLLFISCHNVINHQKTTVINCCNDYNDYNSILFLCESANVETINRSELRNYLTSDELKKANIVSYRKKKSIYAHDYKIYDTLAVSSNFSTELILKVDNTDGRFYDFLIRTYDLKTRQLIDSEIFASWTERLSGEFDKEKQVFKVFDDNSYWEYKINEKGKIIETE